MINRGNHEQSRFYSIERAVVFYEKNRFVCFNEKQINLDQLVCDRLIFFCKDFHCNETLILIFKPPFVK